MDWQPHINLDSLKSWMDAQELGSGEIENPELLTGGTQNFLLKFTRSNRDYVLRRPPAHLRKNSNATMLREARVLKALAGSNVPHPGLIVSCDDESIIGACFYLMEPIDGFNPANGLPALHQSDPTLRNQMGYALVDAIAALSLLDYKAIGLGDFGNPDGFIDRQAPRWRSQLESYHEFENWPGVAGLPAVDEITEWLVTNKPKDFQPGVFHGDFHLANVMFQNNSAKLAAIVDWELCTIGDPLMDLGWLMAGWPDPELGRTIPLEHVQPWDGFPTIKELVARYGEQTGRQLSSATWFGVLACFKLGVILEGTFARACAGKAPKDIGERLHNTTVRLFERGLLMIE